MTRLLRLLLAGFLLAPPGLAGQDVELGGLVEYQGIGYFSTPGDLNRIGRNQLLLQPRIEVEAGLRARALADVELRADWARTVRNRAYVREAYLDLFLGSFDLRVGRALHRWGRADGVNPTDRFTAWDYTDLLAAPDEPIGQNSVALRWYRGSFSLEGILVSRLRASWLPAPEARWWPDFPDSLSVPGPSSSHALPTEFAYGPVSWPDGVTGRTAWGVRASSSWRGSDASLSFYDGPNHIPAYGLNLEPDPDAGVLRGRISRTYYRLRSVGVDFATALGPVGLHGEGAWLDPDDDTRLDPGAQGSWIHWVVGVDYRAGGFLRDRDLFAVVEWSREVRPGSEPEPDPLDLAHVFRDALLGRVELTRPGFGAVELEGAYDLANRGWFLRLARRWNLGDGLLMEARLDLPGGPSGSFFGEFRRNRRLHLLVGYRR